MSMSDCIACWDTPCTCGWVYSAARPEGLRIKIQDIETILIGLEKHQIIRLGDSWMNGDVKCTKCGLSASYKNWTPTFFHKDCI